MMFIDTHAHLDFPQFVKDRDKVIRRAQLEGIGKIINVGSIKLAQKYKDIYAAVGVHPHEAENNQSLDKIKEKLRKLAKQPKVVAIGECGLDYYQLQDEKLKAKQKELFKVQLNLAQELNLPIIIHNRDAHSDILNILKKPVTGVFHCFSGDKNFLQKVIDFGFYLGFCGNLTFKNAKELWEIAKIAPLEKILLETDCPFLSPEPHRGLKNEPKNVKIIAIFLAKLKGISPERIARVTTENAKVLFHLK